MKNTNYLIESGVNLEEALKMLGDMETYDETLPNYKNALIKNINNMHYFLTNNDTDSYAICAHSVKSDSKFFGFMHLADLALDHETNGKEHNTEYLKNHFNEITIEINKTINVINTYLDGQNEMSNKKKVLIADDSEVVIALAKKILEEDYDITSFEDGEDVIKELELNTNYDAMLLDLNMPKVDGFGVLTYMNEHDLFKKIPVSIISGNNDKESIDKAFSFPIVDMLNKPFNDTNIVNVLKKTLSRKK